MEQFITRIQTNLNGVLEMTQMFNGIMMTGDNNANRIIVELNRDGTPVPITNEYSIIGYIIRNDGYTLDVPGTIIEDGHACLDIPSLAYEVAGPLSIAIRMISGDHRIVIATASCYVNSTESNAIIDTAHRIPDLEELLQRMSEIDAEMIDFEASEIDRETAETARETAETARETAEAARETAEAARETAESARETASSAAVQKINGMTVEMTKLPIGSEPDVVISEVQGHKHINFKIAPGDPFVIRKTFASIAEMEAYSGSDIHSGDFVVISSTIEDPDNAKLYLKTDNGYSFITDLSGAQGIKGDKGDKGDTGDTGAKGDTGNTGAQGPKGDKGDKGDKGEPGLNGVDMYYDSSYEVLEVTFY